MRKFTKILCVLLALVFVLTACGGEKKNPTNPGSENGATQSGGEKNPDAQLTLDATELTLKIGETKTLAATFVPEYESDDKTITLSTSDAKIVTVDGMTVTAVATGTATVTAKNADGKFTATCKVTVTSGEQIFVIEYDGETETKNITENPAQTVEVNFGVNFAGGKKLKVTLPEGQKYLAITIGKNVKEAILYVPSGVYEYTVPTALTAIYPSGFVNGGKVSVRIPTAAELTKRFNLALNPYDTTANKSTAYPHVSCNNEYNQNEFAARCAIDGFTQNTGHGYYPVQSWGPKDVVKKTDYFTIDFGRNVLVNEIVVYLRGDFGHDAYFSAITVEFSDGTTQVINPIMTRDGQSFKIPAKVTESVKLTGFVIDSSKGGPWTGLAEVEVYGMEMAG